MNPVQGALTQEFLSLHLIPVECWQRILLFAVQKFKEWAALSSTCCSLRFLVCSSRIIKSLFKQSIRAAMSQTSISVEKVIVFLQRYVPAQDSEKLVLNFSYYNSSITSAHLITIFQAFPKLSKLNLCITPCIHHTLPSLAQIQEIATKASFSYPLKVILWTEDSQEQGLVQKSSIHELASLLQWNICFCPLPLLTAHVRARHAVDEDD